MHGYTYNIYIHTNTYKCKSRLVPGLSAVSTPVCSCCGAECVSVCRCLCMAFVIVVAFFWQTLLIHMHYYKFSIIQKKNL